MNQVLRVPFVDLAAQYATIEDQVGKAMASVLRRTNFILGQDVDLFEKEFAAFCEVEHAIGVDTGTSALELILRACDIGPGDEVITVVNTFIATTLAISYAGAVPVLVDADPQTYNIDVSKLEEAITPRTKAIIPVHLYGQPADMDPIMEIAQRHGLKVIEDACQAHGARYKGRRAGSLGHAAAFSFYPAKNLGAYGDGGIIVTDDEQVDQRVRMLRNYGQREKYNHLVCGFNRRLDTLQAAVLRVKLGYLDEWNDARRRHAGRYKQLLASTPLALPPEADYAESVYHLYVVRTDNREVFMDYMQEQEISTGIHYPIPVHLQPAYQELGYGKGDFPVSERYAEQIVSLPMYPELTPEFIDHVAEAIEQAAGQYSLKPELAVYA